MTLVLLLMACVLTCAGQIAQKYAVEGWRGGDAGIAAKLRSPWLWLALLCLGPVPAFYDAPMLEQTGWRRGRPLSDFVHVDRWSDESSPS